MKQKCTAKALDGLARAITLARPLATEADVSAVCDLFMGGRAEPDRRDLFCFATRRVWLLVQRYIVTCIVVGDEQCDSAGDAHDDMDTNEADAPVSDEAGDIRWTASYICLDNRIRTYDETGELLGDQVFILDEEEVDDLTGKERWDWFYEWSMRMGANETALTFQDNYFFTELNTLTKGGKRLRSDEDYLEYLAAALALSEVNHDPKTIRTIVELLTAECSLDSSAIDSELSSLNRAIQQFRKSHQPKPVSTREDARLRKLQKSPYYLVVFPESDLVVALVKSSLDECFRFPLSAAIPGQTYSHDIEDLERVFDYFMDKYCVAQMPGIQKAG